MKNDNRGSSVNIAITLVSILMCIFHLITAAYILHPLLQRSIHLFFGLILIFLIFPYSKNQNKKNWTIDIILLALGVVVTLYIALNYKILGGPMRIAYPTVIDKIFGVIAVLIVLEATRRVIGPAMPILAIIFITYAFLAPYLPGIFNAPGTSFSSFIAQGYIYVHGIFGTTLGVSATVVFVFILFGAMYQASGAGDLFIGLSLALFGKLVGGPAKMAVVSSALFGTISGSSVANVATTGSFTIPLMKKVGYEPNFAGATEAAASIGGQLMPPVMGASAFVMAEILGIPYLTVVKAAIIPAILYFSSIFLSVDFYARKNKLKILSKEKIPNPLSILRKSGILLLPLILTIYLFAFMQWYPTRVAFWVTISTILLALLYKEKRKSLIWVIEGAKSAAKNGLVPIVACACAGLIILPIQITGLGHLVGQFLIILSQENLFLLLFFSMILTIILGMGLPTVAAYTIAAIIVAPSIMDLGAIPLAAHMFVFYFAIMSSITPPVALSAYTGAGIAGGDPTKTGFLAFGLAFPSFLLAYRFIFHTVLLMESITIGSLVYQILVVFLGFIILISAARGQLFNWFVPNISRFIFVISGILTILPNKILTNVLSSDLMGFLVFLVGFFYMILQNKKQKGNSEKEL